MSLYSWILIGSFIGPFALSFDKKVAFYRNFIPLVIAILLVAIPFLVWDIYFTEAKVWGFTPDYLSGVYIFNLPIEECLFFVVIPFACIFIYEVLGAYFPNYSGIKTSRIVGSLILISSFSLALCYHQNYYTYAACSLSFLLTLIFQFVLDKDWFPSFLRCYLVAIVPFLFVNGLLTGAMTEDPVVWYSSNHITGIRVYTIPLEDFFYNYDLLLLVTALYLYLKKKFL